MWYVVCCPRVRGPVFLFAGSLLATPMGWDKKISLGPDSGIYASDFALSSYALIGRFDRRGRINTIFRILFCLSTFPEESLKTKSLRYK